jgi:hypothetical protein
VLKTLVPAQSLNAENFQELAGKTVVEEVPAGRLVFKKGDTDRKAVYVLSGDVELVGDSGTAFAGIQTRYCQSAAATSQRQGEKYRHRHAY